MKKKDATAGNSAIDVVEEAVHLLRDAPLKLHGIYALGTLPFVLGFLYFWADMSRGAYAREHAAAAAMGMGLLYIWMKCWQAVFADGLRSQRTGQPGAPWTFRRVCWLALKQGALQPSGLFVVPIASLALIPFGWVLAFYQNLTALGTEPGGLRESFNAAARQTNTRAGQNHLILGVFSVFIFFVWMNVVITMAWVPFLLKTLLGVETAFTRSGIHSIFNTTYFFCSFALTYIFVDPLIKAVYVLRCFYGRSLLTGDDLKSDLARVQSAGALSMAVLAAFLFVSASNSVSAAESNSAPAQVSSKELDHSIDKVLQRPEFAWRMPREEAKEVDTEHMSWLARAIESVVKMLTDMAKYFGHEIGKLIKWIFDLLSKLWPHSHSSESRATGWAAAWITFLRTALIVLIVCIAGFLGVMLTRMWRQRRRPMPVTAAPMTAAPDLNDKNITANQLPEDGWLKLAREMIAQGNLRLALRALYLAGLANLAGRELIAIASFKSNREYEAELRRRARALPAVQTAFSKNGAAFDRAWYGQHEVTPDGLQEFQTNLEQIRAC